MSMTIGLTVRNVGKNEERCILHCSKSLHIEFGATFAAPYTTKRPVSMKESIRRNRRAKFAVFRRTRGPNEQDADTPQARNNSRRDGARQDMGHRLT